MWFGSWLVARAFAPRRACCCSAEDRPSVTHNFKPVSQATNMPANRRQLPSTSPFVSAVTIVERRGWGEKNKCETLTLDAVHRWGLKHDSCIGDRWIIRVLQLKLSRYSQTSTVMATFDSQSQHWIFTRLFCSSYICKAPSRAQKHPKHSPYDVFQVVWSHKIDLCDKQTNI